MDLIFPAPSTRHPSGGVSMIYEYASCMAHRGHRVHLYHVDYFQADVTSLDDIDWFDFTEDLVHHFARGQIEPATIPDADVIFGFSTEEQMPRHAGLPVVLLQGHKMLGERRERHAFTAPCPKVCVASWLIDVGRSYGVPDRQLVHVPLGLRHEKYRLTRPIAGRGPRVSFCYSEHPQKSSPLALDVLAAVRERVPTLEVVAFGAVAPSQSLPEWVTFVTNPDQEFLVDQIYNTSRVFLCTSEVEGFGLTSVEAMAGGAALVTTDNGGCSDYAFHDRTALLAPTRATDALTDHVVLLLADDERQQQIATAGAEHARTFDWSRTGEILERFLEQYVDDPVSYGRPAMESSR